MARPETLLERMGLLISVVNVRSGAKLKGKKETIGLSVV